MFMEYAEYKTPERVCVTTDLPILATYLIW